MVIEEGAVVWIEKARTLGLVIGFENGTVAARDRFMDVHHAKRHEVAVILTPGQAETIGAVLRERELGACPPADEGAADPRDAEERRPEIACSEADCRSMCPHLVCPDGA